MSKTLAVMQTNVGNMVGDTGSTFAALIKVWINDRYKDISRRHAWSALIDENYTFPTVSGTAEYTLPTLFEQEIYLADITDGFALKRDTEGYWWAERNGAYSGGSIQQGTPSRYVILRESGKFKLDPTPNVVHTLAMPYKKLIADLSGSSDTVVITDIERIIEFGAMADALFYKKQYQKAMAFTQKYEIELAERIGQEQRFVNQSYQFVPGNADTNNPRPMLGWNSYDSI